MTKSRMAYAALAFIGMPALADGAAFTNGEFIDTNCDYFCTLQAGSTTIPAWVVTRGNIDLYAPGNFQRPPLGGNMIDLEGCCGNQALAGGIAQTFDTISGSTYKVSFYLSGNPDGGNPLKIMGVSAGSFDGTFKYDTATHGTTESDMHFIAKSFVFTAYSSSTTLTFISKTKRNFGWGPVIGDVAVTPSVASGLATLYSFTGGTDGSTPNGGLIFNASGQLYGTTFGGGGSNAGTIFSFSPTTSQLTTEYSFTAQADGGQPLGKLTLDASGTIYGTTLYGGGANNAGTIYKFVPGASQFTPLYAFKGLSDGGAPNGGLLFDHAGNLDGTATAGGTYNFGAVFQLNPGTLQEITLASFNGAGKGNHPNGLPTLGRNGLVYGVTSKGGGSSDSGIAFSVNPAKLKETVLYSFANGDDGGAPDGGLVFDSAGNAYGTTRMGGTGDAGTIYELNPATHQLTTLYNFTGATDGAGPGGGMIFDSAGNLYGVTVGTGKFPSSGTLFKFSPTSGDFATLYTFTGGADGDTPRNALVFDTAGSLYGTTQLGGTSGYGTIFRFTP